MLAIAIFLFVGSVFSEFDFFGLVFVPRGCCCWLLFMILTRQ